MWCIFVFLLNKINLIIITGWLYVYIHSGCNSYVFIIWLQVFSRFVLIDNGHKVVEYDVIMVFSLRNVRTCIRIHVQMLVVCVASARSEKFMKNIVFGLVC